MEVMRWTDNHGSFCDRVETHVKSEQRAGCVLNAAAPFRRNVNVACSADVNYTTVSVPEEDLAHAFR
jgi:hypothetical protein